MKILNGEGKKVVTSIVVVILIAIALWTQNEDVAKYIKENYDIDLKIGNEKNDSEDIVDIATLDEYKVVRVVDGDTFVIDYNGKEERVRLIGIDTPESVHPNEEKNTKEGIKTSNYTKERLEGKMIKLELDVQERDKYGRILAYVYVDGNMYNKELLELGYAKLATYPPNVKYVDDFTKLQEQARENKVGLWK
jgi:micrococcal nuclease